MDATNNLELPQEMSEHIMNFLRYDLKSLKSCRLVCKSWSIAARPDLFRTLVVDETNIEAIIAIPAILSPYFKVMPYVKEINLQTVQYFTAFKSPNSILTSLSSTLTSIRLFRCYLDTFVELVDAIQMFPCLKDLTLENIDWKVADTRGVSPHNNWSPSTLTRLRLKNTRMSSFVQWILGLKESLVISEFEATPVKEEDLPSVCKFCLTISGTVKCLRLHIDANGLFTSYTPSNSALGQGCILDTQIAKLYSTAFNMTEYRTLGIFSKLESLHIDKFMNSSRDDQCDSVFWTPQIMSKIDPPHVFKYLTLQLVISRTGELDQYGHRWDFFDEALGGDIFINFQYLEFEVVGKVDLEAVASLLSHHLPRLASRGRLRFSYL